MSEGFFSGEGFTPSKVGPDSGYFSDMSNNRVKVMNTMHLEVYGGCSDRSDRRAVCGMPITSRNLTLILPIDEHQSPVFVFGEFKGKGVLCSHCHEEFYFQIFLRHLKNDCPDLQFDSYEALRFFRNSKGSLGEKVERFKYMLWHIKN